MAQLQGFFIPGILGRERLRKGIYVYRTYVYRARGRAPGACFYFFSSTRRPGTRKSLPSPGIFEGGESKNVIFFRKLSRFSLEFSLFLPIFCPFLPIFPPFSEGGGPKTPQRWNFRVKIFTELGIFGGDKPKFHSLTG